MIDFTIKDTKLPIIPKGTKYRLECWSILTHSKTSGDYTNFKSFGKATLNNELWILAERKDYKGEIYFMFKLSDIQKLAKEQGMIKNEEQEKFIVPELWYVKPDNLKEAKILAKYFDANNCGAMFEYSDSPAQTLNLGLSNGKYGYLKSDKHTQITFKQFKKYILNKDMKKGNKKIIGYKLIKPEYEKAALKICNSVGFLKSPYSFVFKSMPYEALKQAGVLDLWFEPVYEEIKKIISMGNFDLKVTKDGIFHKNENITSYVRSIYIKYNNFINHHEIINCYSFNIKDIILSSTGCENSETKLSQWLEVWKVYQEIVNLDVFSN